MPKYKLVMFDSDGTLADTLPWMQSALGELGAKYGIPRLARHETELLRTLPTLDALKRMQIPLWKVPALLTGVRRIMAEHIDQFALFDGIADALKRLAAGGVILGVVSSNSRANVERILGAQLAPLVRHYGCGASMFGKAPKLRIVLKAAKVSPDQAIYIGDEVRDAEAARKSGVAFGAVGWGCHTLDTLRRQAPAEMFSHPADIANQLVS